MHTSAVYPKILSYFILILFPSIWNTSLPNPAVLVLQAEFIVAVNVKGQFTGLGLSKKNNIPSEDIVCQFPAELKT